MKKNIFLLMLIFTKSFASAPPYPVLLDAKGKVLVATARDEKLSPALKNQILREKAKISLNPGSQIVLKLDEKRKLILMDEAQVVLPGISWESGEAPIVILEKGSIRWIQNEKATYQVMLKSALFEFSPPLADFVIKIDPDNAFSEALVVKGQLEFQAMNAENSVILKTGQKARFQGVLENDEIAYDVLLKGRKIPKGRLSDVTSFSQADYDRYSEEAQRKLEETEKRKIAKKLAEDNKLLPGQICRHPNAKLNECSWTCEGNPKKEQVKCRLDLAQVKCVRRRCNANGAWAEEKILEKDDGQVMCSVKALVKKCDY